MESKTLLKTANAELRILGIKLNCVSYAEMMDRFDAHIHNSAGRAFSVALVNVNCCVSALMDSNVRRVYQNADLRGVDSMPFLYLAKMLKARSADRLYAPDMMLKLAEYSAERNYRFFLYGGSQEAPEKMREYLVKRYPDVQISGMYSPPFRALSSEEDERICEMIRESGANILWVGLGSPKQDIWIEQHRSKLPGIVVIAAGATFDFFSGGIRQAPVWIRKSGFEWLYRLFQDPKRLWKRYTLYNIVFLCALMLELAGLVNLGPTMAAPLAEE